MIELDSSKFDYNKHTMVLSAESSSCGFNHCEPLDTPDSGRYEGNAGIAIKSHKTGVVKRFGLVWTEYDSTHEDILAWHFMDTLWLNPSRQNGLKVVIYND